MTALDPTPLPTPNAFGQLWTATTVERAVIGQLQTWLNTYLAEVENREPGYERGDIRRPRTWQSDVDVDKLPEAQVPAVVVVVGAENPQSDGRYLNSTLSLVVGVMLRGSTRAQGRDLARLYTAAIKGALLHRPDVGGTVHRLTYDGAAYGETTGDTGVTAANATLSFTAVVGNTLDLYAGPETPLPSPPDTDTWPDYPDWGVVDETHVDVQPVEEVPQP